MDWDDLELALTSPRDECAWYLDIKTGAVRLSLAASAFGDEVNELSEDQIKVGLDAGDLIEIEPLRPAMEYAWMTAFAVLVSDVVLRERLTEVLDGRGAFSRFKRNPRGPPGRARRLVRVPPGMLARGNAQMAG